MDLLGAEKDQLSRYQTPVDTQHRRQSMLVSSKLRTISFNGSELLPLGWCVIGFKIDDGSSFVTARCVPPNHDAIKASRHRSTIKREEKWVRARVRWHDAGRGMWQPQSPRSVQASELLDWQGWGFVVRCSEAFRLGRSPSSSHPICSHSSWTKVLKSCPDCQITGLGHFADGLPFEMDFAPGDTVLVHRQGACVEFQGGRWSSGFGLQVGCACGSRTRPPMSDTIETWLSSGMSISRF